MGSLPEQQFTFSSPVSETSDDAPHFDYEAWIEHSKNSYYASQEKKSYAATLDGEVIKRHHQEMVLQAMEDMSEDAYELSLRDLTDLSRAVNAAQQTGEKRETSSGGRKKSWRKRLSRSVSLEGAGLILKMFMPSPSSMRKKSFSVSSSPAVPTKSALVNGERSMKSKATEMANVSGNKRSNSMPRKGSKDSNYRRTSVGCYPFFKASKYKVKQITGDQYCS